MSTHFTRWQDVARIDIADPEFRALTERAMDQLWAIPEMRDLMVGTYANTGGMPVRITGVDDGGNCYANPITGTINLNPNDLATAGYKTDTGETRMTLTSVLVHEYFHLADPARNGPAIRGMISGMLGDLTATLVDNLTLPSNQDAALSQKPLSLQLVEAVADVSGEPMLRDLARGNFDSPLFEGSEEEVADRVMGLMRTCLDTISDPDQLRQMETILGLEPDTLKEADATVVMQRMEIVAERFGETIKVEGEDGVPLSEANATNWTDYIMGRHFSEAPRGHYYNSVTMDEAPITLSTPRFNPADQRFQYVHVGETPPEFVPQPGLPTLAEIMGGIDLAWQK